SCAVKRSIKIVLALVVVAVVGVVLFSRSNNRAQRDLEATRQLLHQQGFKTDLTEFNLSTPPEISRRAALLASTTWAAMTNQNLRTRSQFIQAPPTLLQPAGPDSAIVIWRLNTLKVPRNPDLWPILRQELSANRERLDLAAAAAVSGPIRFEPLGSPKPNPALPYLADLKNLEISLNARTMLSLHDGDQANAWTNLLAASCLVTAYEPEPIDISQLVRFSCVTIAYDCLWNALQSQGWTDDQLAELQHRWETVDLWSSLPDTAAYSRASMAAICELERHESVTLFGSLRGMLGSPFHAWAAISNYRQRLHYLNQGSYEDEQALLLYYRDREVELRQAIASPSWSEMERMPSVRNPPIFRSKYSSRSVALMNSRAISARFQAQGQGILARAADAEARRRIIVTALALERYRLRHHAYPQTLQELVPDFLKSSPVDFMDGKPLRYRLTADSHFVLHSVGLDGVDDQGKNEPGSTMLVYGEQMGRARFPASGQGPASVGLRRGEDIVWPRPASASEVESLQEQESRFAAEQREQMEQEQAAGQWANAIRRQAKVDAILAAPLAAITNKPSHHGKPLTELLRMPSAAGPAKVTLAELLTLKPVVTGAEPEVATFELPINFDVLTNIGALHLFVDPAADQGSDAGCSAERFECRRGPSGSCLLDWSTIYEAPGRHALQAGLFFEDSEDSEDSLVGPVTACNVSNLCQFSTSSGFFEPAFGPTIRARLAEAAGEYKVEINLPGGQHVKTFSGATTNGLLRVHWDLKDEQGRPCTNMTFETIVTIRLSGSGRTQRLKGP
ncbi:MAG TPA: hypothetical protein VL793_17670, partial [Patescibacteria group bacterium]|nr:hypothetical protein [Patescibacteria group bacterium]